MKKYYAGIGSRKTPQNILSIMRIAAGILEQKGYILRSGGAPGADSAFEEGVTREENKEIYLPWPGFQGRSSKWAAPTKKALEVAKKFHPAWEKLGGGAKNLIGRNTHQLFGYDFTTTSEFIICWTPEAKITGGTGQALRIANYYSIPVINLGKDDGIVKLLSMLFGPERI